MSFKESPCRGCENNCCEKFVIYGLDRERVESLVATYPFLRVVERDVRLVNGGEAMATVFECDRLEDDGSCRGWPDNRPKFCEQAGMKNRPAENCKLFQLMVLNNPDKCE